MKCWTLDETMEWLRSVNIPTRDRGIILDETWTARRTDLPKESYFQARISREFIESIQPFQGCLFWLTEWGVFPNYQNPVLMERLRLSYGETRSLRDAPAFSLEPSEKELAIALIRLIIMFAWDGYLVSPTGDLVVIIIGHEEFAEVCERQRK